MNRSSGFVTCLLIAIAVVSCVCSGCCGQPAAPPLEELPPSQGLPDGVALVGIETLPPEAAPEGVTGFTAAVGATYQWEDAVVEMTFIESGSPEQADTVFTQLLNALPSEFAKWPPATSREAGLGRSPRFAGPSLHPTSTQEAAKPPGKSPRLTKATAHSRLKGLEIILSFIA